MMRCHMPPSNCPTATQDGELFFDVVTYRSCIELHDTFNLVFDEPGILFYLSPGHFVPEIPMGVFTQGEVPVPFTAVTEGQIKIFFTSFQDTEPKTYVEILSIKAKCKPVHPKSEDESHSH
jgi:hypothetical protein